MSTPAGAAFVIVRPAKAVELKDGFAQRVTPESSLHALTSEVVDKSTGMLSGEKFSTQAFELAAFGVAEAKESVLQIDSDEDQRVVVVGRLTNAQELREAHLPDEKHEMNDAALIGKLYRKMQNDKHKYAFVSELKGEFALALYCAHTDNCLAARDPSGKFMLMQGVDKKTGGLVVTNALLTTGHELHEIPGGMFIFGKFRERHLHPMHKETSTPEASIPRRSMDAARRASSDGSTSKHSPQTRRWSMDSHTRSHARRGQSLDLPASSQREAACSAASRALAGLTSHDHARDPFEAAESSSVAAVPKGRTTPSAKGTADKHSTWRRASLEEISEEKENEETANAAHTPTPVIPPSRTTTTPSAKGTADLAGTWRKSPEAAAPAPAAADAAALNSWTPVALSSFLGEFSGGDKDDPAPEDPTHAEASSENPLDYAVQGIHTELLTQALDEFMEGAASPRPSPSMERLQGLSRSSYEDLLALSRMQGSRRVQVKSNKAAKKPSHKIKKETTVAENTLGSPNCGVKSAGKRFLARF